MNKKVIKGETLFLNKNEVTKRISKFTRGVMLPLILLPMAALLLGLGSGAENIINQIMMPDNFGDLTSIEQNQIYDSIAAASFVFTIMKTIGNIIYVNLPVLFCMGIIISFSGPSGSSILSGVVGWVVFNATQSTMIWEAANGTYDVLWLSNVPASMITHNMGFTSLNTSLFGGIVIGLYVSYLYNRFHTFQMPRALGFFSGTRLVPILAFLTAPLWGFTFLIIWPLIGISLESLGQSIVGLPFSIDSFLFGTIEKVLVPFGLDQTFYSPELFTDGISTLYNSELIDYYNQGRYAYMMFGIPMAGAAMIVTSKKENRQLSLLVIGTASVASLLTGIGEPLELIILFLSPVLYFGFHIWMSGLSFMLTDLFSVQILQGSSTGLIDYILFGILPSIEGIQTSSWWILIIGLFYAPIYYFVFYFSIEKKNTQTVGNMKYWIIPDNEVESKLVPKINSKKVLLLIENLGGIENIVEIEACITRLRLSVKSRKLVKDDELISMGAMSIVGKGKTIQVIFGTDSDVYKTAIKKIMRKEGEK